MRQSLLILFGCLFASGMFVQATAQSTDATADVTATVIGLLNIDVTQDVVIGDVMPGQTIFMDSNDEDEYPDGQLGRFEVTGAADADVLYSYNSTVTLEGPGSAEMTFTPNAHATGNDAFGHGQSELIPGGTVHALSSSGKAYIFVGGELAVGAEQAAGDYTGQITLTAEYN